MDTTWWVLIVGALLAGFVQGLSGFAFGLVASSIWAWWLPPQLVAVLIVFGSLFGQLLALATARRSLQAAKLWPLLAGGLCGIPMGLWLLPRLDQASFQLCVGLLLASWCPLMLLSGRLPRLPPQPAWAHLVIGGLGGFAGAVSGFSGVLPTLWFTLQGWDRDTLRGVIQNFNLALLSVTALAYLSLGFVQTAMWPQLAAVAAATVLPVLLGAKVYRGISPEAFKRWVLVLLSAAGLLMLLRSTFRL